MSDIAADLEKTKVSLGTVIKVGTSLVGFIIFVTGVYFRLESLEKHSDALESRVHNLEEHVVWRRE